MKVLKRLKEVYFDATIRKIEDGFDLIENSPQNVEYIPDRFLNEQDDSGWTLLIFASFARQADAVENLLSRGADKNLKTDSDTSAYDYAFLTSPEIPDQLVQKLVIN
ncbi:MAG: hypothetical protein COB76_04450 [Alphaproteobacteria bacterium]|nr:MAG: hypothetical protein COB76_04450 [Alphaproteobacteria bacterium]